MTEEKRSEKPAHPDQPGDSASAAPAVPAARTDGTVPGAAAGRSRHPELHKQTTVHGHAMDSANILKFAGLIAFFVIMIAIVAFVWPYIGDLFEPGGLDRMLHDIREAGAVGFLLVLAIQFLQIVVAFIPGEVVQVAAGMIYGPWMGALVIWLGCVVSSAFVFLLVNKLGAPFVRAMVPEKYMGKFEAFEQSGKLTMIVFILFLIPGMPKDVFTYLVPLTSMPLKTFLIASNVARIPGIIVSTYAASGLVEGRIGESVVIFLIAAAIAVVAVVFYDRIMKALERHASKK